MGLILPDETIFIRKDMAQLSGWNTIQKGKEIDEKLFNKIIF
jgi:hypothetical protein